MRYDPLLEYFDSLPGIDVEDTIEEILLYPQLAGDRVDGHDRVRETFCENLTPLPPVKRDIGVFSLGQGLEDPFALGLEEEEEGEDGLARRVISIFRVVHDQPNLRNILEAINAGTIQLQYARWQVYRGGGQTPARTYAGACVLSPTWECGV